MELLAVNIDVSACVFGGSACKSFIEHVFYSKCDTGNKPHIIQTRPK